MSKLLNVEEFAAAVGWKPATVRQKVWRREIEYIKIGRSIRFKPATADKLIEAGTVPPLEPGKAATSHTRRSGAGVARAFHHGPKPFRTESDRT